MSHLEDKASQQEESDEHKWIFKHRASEKNKATATFIPGKIKKDLIT